MNRKFWLQLVVSVAGLWPMVGKSYTADECTNCAKWNVPHEPFQVYGNTYYVGTQGLSVILIASPQGHILIDGALPESAPLVAANIRSLGFRVEDVKLILNSHDHSDHAGGIAELQRLSHAKVMAGPSSAKVLAAGKSDSDDPQYGMLLPFPRVSKPRVLRDGKVIKLGTLALTAHFTPGHTRGGTTWTWRSCQQNECKNMVYADSISAASAPDFKFGDNKTYPEVLKDFEHSFSVLENLPCDILLTPHPEASGTWQKLERRFSGDKPDPFEASGACKEYAGAGRRSLAQRLQMEQQPQR